MSWFNFNKRQAQQAPVQEQADENEKCQCQADSLSFQALFGRDYSYRSLSPVFASVELISNAISSMPMRVVRTDSHGHQEVVNHDPLNVIFRNKNIQTMTMQQTMKSVISDILLKGAGYILINRSESGVVTSLRYLPYGSVSVDYNEYKDQLSYIVTTRISNDTTRKSRVKPCDILHFTKVTRDGVNGQSVMHFAKGSADLAKSAEDAAAQFFESNMNVSGLLSCKTMMNEQQRKSIKDSWTSGRGKNTLQILPLGVDYIQLGVSGKDAQLLESRTYNSLVISQFFGVPEQLINSAAKLTYSSLEQLNLYFFQHTLLPFITMIEAEMSRKLFPGDTELYVDMDESEFLFRTDKKSEAEYISKLVGGGIITVNEARLMLGMGEVEDGDTLHIAYSDADKAQIGNSPEN